MTNQFLKICLKIKTPHDRETSRTLKTTKIRRNRFLLEDSTKTLSIVKKRRENCIEITIETVQTVTIIAVKL